MRLGTGKCKVGDTCEFTIDMLGGGGGAEPVKLDTVDAKITGPSGPVQTDFNPRDGKGHFTATEYGMHEVVVTNEGEAVKGAPAFIRSMPNSKKDYDGIEPCAVGSTVEVLVSVCVQKCFIKSKMGLLCIKDFVLFLFGRFGSRMGGLEWADIANLLCL